MQQYVIFNVLKEYCIPKEEEEGLLLRIELIFSNHTDTDTDTDQQILHF